MPGRLLVGGCWSAVPTARFHFDFCATLSLITAASADHVFYILNVAGMNWWCMHAWLLMALSNASTACLLVWNHGVHSFFMTLS
jgi:hypothetical protein